MYIIFCKFHRALFFAYSAFLFTKFYRLYGDEIMLRADYIIFYC